MIEQAFFDLSARQPAVARVASFTHADDKRWAGAIELAPGDRFETRADERTDILLLHGALTDNASEPVAPGGFVSLQGRQAFTAGGHGAVLFAYREPGQSPAAAAIVPRAQRPWRPAHVRGMQVADLMRGGYQLSLVAWAAGTHVGRHDHPAGEEILVLEGALESQGQSLPAGSWIRLHPGSTHTPVAPEHALILLRNGHLRG